jgi:thymidylate kinase
MIFVLEGPDGTGKTTLAQHMTKQLKAEYLHLSYRWPDHMFEYHHAAIRWAIRKNHKSHVILDRWWPSETLYAAEYRGGSRWPWINHALDSIAQQNKVLYIYCLPQDLKSYAARFEKLKAERDEMYSNTTGVAKRYLELWDIYKYRRDHLKYVIEENGDNLTEFTKLALKKATQNEFK